MSDDTPKGAPVGGEVDPGLLEILVCPVTKGPLRYDRARIDFVHGQVLRRAGKRKEADEALTCAREAFAALGAVYVDGEPASSRCSAERSVFGELYLSSRATRVCLAFARPRPIGSTPSLPECGGPARGWTARVATPTE